MSVWGFGMSQEWRRIVAPVVAEGWTEPRKTRITLVLPSALSIEWSGPRLYRVTGQAELGMLLCVADTPDGTPWYRLEPDQPFATPEWIFPPGSLSRWGAGTGEE